jgi:hypothetical protein
MKGFIVRFFSLLMFILIVTCPLAFAQSRDAKSGRLNAFICEPLPPAPVLDVEMLDDAPRYQQLKDKFASVLRKNGIDVRAGAPLVLTIDLKTLRDSQASDKHDLGELRLGKDGGVSLRGNLWSNSADSVLGGRKKSSPGYDTTYLAITASLNRRDDGGCVWQGELVHDLKGDDPDRSAYGFVAPLADAIGQSIWNKSVVMSD